MARAKLQLRPAKSAPAPAEPTPLTRRTALTRQGTRVVAAHVPPATWANLRQLGIQQNRTVQELMVEALDDLFAKHRRG